MKAKITVLGAGGAFANMERGNSAFLVEVQHRRILIDCGTTVPYVLRDEMCIPLESVTDVIITHCHADHAGGLEQLLLSHRWIGGSKPVLWASCAVVAGIRAMLSHLRFEADGTFTKYGTDKHAYVEEVKTGARVKLGPFMLRLPSVHHVGSMPATGVVLGDLLAISGDTCRSVLSELKEENCRLIFHEATWGNDGVHTPVKELAECMGSLDEYRGKRVYVYHCPEKNEKVRPLPNLFAGILSKGDIFEEEI